MPPCLVDGGGTVGQLHQQHERIAMRTTLRIVALTLALSCPVLAGDIPHMVTGPPPPPPPASTSSTTPGEISTGVAGDISTTSMTETALNLLQSVLALF
jgi:hypothetical protein